MDSKVALVVCTYNRCDTLAQLLGNLAHMRLPPGGRVTMVVVDNNSSDGTADIVASFQPRLPLVYVFERRLGKAFALNAGLGAIGDSDVVVFTDDDVVLPPEWLTRFMSAFDALPRYGWFGGRVLSSWPGGRPPSWLHDDTRAALAGYFVDYDLGQQSRPYVDGDRLPTGAAMAVRNDVFEKIGVFREDLGPRGKRRGVGEETELLERAIAAGYRGFYVADACCHHPVDPRRMRWTEFFLFGIGKGINQYRAEGNGCRAGSLRIASGQVARGAWQLVKGRRDRFRVCLINAGIEVGRCLAAREASGQW